MLQQTRVFLSDELVYSSQSQFCLFNLLPQVLILEFYYLLQLFVVLLVQLQVNNLDVLELRCVIQSQSALPVRANQHPCAHLFLRLLDLVQAFYNHCRQFLQVDGQLLLPSYQSESVLIASAF